MVSALEVIIDLLHTVADAFGQKGQFFVEAGVVHLQGALVIVEQAHTDD